MGNAKCTLQNDAFQQVTVRTYNNADTVYSNAFQTYTFNPGEQKTINAAADAWGLKVKVAFEGEEFSDAHAFSNGSFHRVSEVVPLHSLKLYNDTDAPVEFVATDRNNRNSNATVSPKAVFEFKNLIRGEVTVSVVKKSVASSVTRSNSNGTVNWDGTNLRASN